MWLCFLFRRICFCVSEIDAGDILQLFGKMFFEFCQESGYDTILRVLGSNVREFLQVLLTQQTLTLMSLMSNDSAAQASVRSALKAEALNDK